MIIIEIYENAFHGLHENREFDIYIVGMIAPWKCTIWDKKG